MVELGRSGQEELGEHKYGIRYYQLVAQRWIVAVIGVNNGIRVLPNAALLKRFRRLVKVGNVAIGVASIVVKL